MTQYVSPTDVSSCPSFRCGTSTVVVNLVRPLSVQLCLQHIAMIQRPVVRLRLLRFVLVRFFCFILRRRHRLVYIMVVGNLQPSASLHSCLSVIRRNLLTFFNTMNSRQ